MATLPTSQFVCYVTNDESIPSVETFAFVPEGGKRSSFILTAPHDDATLLGVEAPAHLCIQAVSLYDNRCVPFVLGGFEIVSNSRNLEIYVSDENNKEAYLTTCRGIKWRPDSNAIVTTSPSAETNAIDKQQPPDDTLHKALLVIPGGPRTMTRIRFKMLSIQPPSHTKSLVHIVKLKGRLPQVEQIPSEPQHLHHVRNNSTDLPQCSTTHSSPPQEQPLSTSDVAAALAGVSMMVHSTEERLTKVLESSLIKLNQGISHRLQGVERVVGMQWNAIQQLQQQNAMILQQQEHILLEMRKQHSIHAQILESLTSLQLSNSLPQENEVVASGMEEEDSKPPSRLLGVTQPERIHSIVPTAETTDGLVHMRHFETLDEDESQSQVCTEFHRVGPVPAVDDEDSKPPLRRRSVGNAVGRNLSSPTVELEIETPHAKKDTSDSTTDGIEQVGIETEATVGVVDSIVESTIADVVVLEDDDSKPPSRTRVDDDSQGAAIDSAQRSSSRKTPNVSHDHEIPLPAIAADPQPSGEIACSGVEDAEVDDDERNRHMHDDDNEDKAVDIVPEVLLDAIQAAYVDNDRPPSRTRQDEDQTTGQMLVLEPPDKGCGGPNDEVADDDVVPETDLIDFS